MEIFKPGQRFSFNYVSYDQNNSLDVAFSIFDVSSGTPVFLTKVAGINTAFGTYTAGYVGLPNKTYLIIGAQYTDNTYVTITPNTPPAGDCYRADDVSGTSIPFSYGAYDMNNLLYIKASVFDVTTAPTFVDYVYLVNLGLGFYFGAFTGVLGKTYQVSIVAYTDNTYSVVDLYRSPSTQGFECFQVQEDITIEMDQATLVAQGCDTFCDLGPVLNVTQGDTAIFNFTATTSAGPLDLTGAVFETQIKGLGGNVVVIPNGQHTANPNQSLNPGKFQVSVTAIQTAEFSIAAHKDVLTKVTLGGQVLYFQGHAILNVYPNVPVK